MITMDTKTHKQKSTTRHGDNEQETDYQYVGHIHRKTIGSRLNK